jgi:ketosteroid isomerase-like protein
MALGIAALAAGTPTAFAADKATEKALKAEYVKYMNAVKAKDMATLDSMMAPDFKMQMGKQTWNRKQSMDMMKQQLAMTKSFDKWDYTFGPVTRKGNMATGIVHEHTATTVMGQDKKLHKMTDTGASKSTFRRMGREWKVVNVVSMGGKMTMDGKPYDPMKAMAKDQKMKNGSM